MRRALAIVALVVASACASPAASSDTPAAPGSIAPTTSAAPSVAPTPSPSATASPLVGAAPVSAGAVPDAGVLYVWGSDDGIYRYDGTTGVLDRVSGKASLAREMAFGAYVLGRHGGIELLKWDGTTSQVCNGGLYADVSTRGNCAFQGAPNDPALYTDSPEGSNGAPLPRLLLPANWGVSQFAWDWNGLQLAIVRWEARPEPVRGHATLWVMDLRHGTLRKTFDSSSQTSFLSQLTWSSGTSEIAFLEQTSTSASFAADGVGVHLWVVDTTTGVRTDLGQTLLKGAWLRWSTDGRLAFVRGGGRQTWGMKQLVVRAHDGSQVVVAGSLGALPAANDRVALAPAWQPSYRDAKLAWIESPAMAFEASPDYFSGVGPSAERVAVLDGAARVSCPDRVTEGVRWSADGKSVLLLCRVAAVDRHALEIWYAPLGGTARPLVKGLGDLGFGYYGLQPSLFDITAWSLADR